MFYCRKLHTKHLYLRELSKTRFAIRFADCESGFKRYCLGTWGCLKSWLLFRHPHEFKIKSLYSNDLILNIASKSKETVQKLKFLDSPIKEVG